MTTFIGIMSALILGCLAITIKFFKKGGIYNPVEPKDFTDLSYLPEPLNAPVTSSTPEPSPLSVPVETTPKTPNKGQIPPSLFDFCSAIRDFEGAPGDRNYRNNNPGNCRFYNGGYLPAYLPVLKDKDGFAIFKDYATGWKYLVNMVKAKIHLHPNQTILDFMTSYAPESDNNPTKKYAQFIAKRLGVDIDFQVKNLV